MVSVIMPTYNRAYIIERAVKSVLQQTYSDWELIIVDDGSTDNTKEVLEKYISSKIRYYANSVNKGANVARNTGVAHAKGEVLAFLDSDNYWPDYRLEIQMKQFEENQGRRCFFYGKVQITDGENVRVIPEGVPDTDELKEAEVYSNVIDMNTVLIKKNLFDEAGGANENIARLQDWELILRFLFYSDFESVGCEKLLSFNEIQKNSIGNTESFIDAYDFILNKYLCNYLSNHTIVEYFTDYWINFPNERNRIEKMVSKVGIQKPALLLEAIKYLEKYRNILEEKEQIAQQREQFLHTSRGMENLLYRWHKKNAEEKTGSFFSNYFYPGSRFRRIAIYGLGKLGWLLYDEIQALPVDIVYGIDKEKAGTNILPVVHPDHILEPVDLIIVAVLNNSEQIKNNLRKTYNGEVVTLAELVLTM